jgi:hypothetical protein
MVSMDGWGAVADAVPFVETAPAGTTPTSAKHTDRIAALEFIAKPLLG